MVNYRFVRLEQIFNFIEESKLNIPGNKDLLSYYEVPNEHEIDENNEQNIDIIKELKDKKGIISCITMFDEEYHQLEETIQHIEKNYKEIEDQIKTIVIIVDGLDKFYKKTRENEQFKKYFDMDKILNYFHINRSHIQFNYDSNDKISEEFALIDKKLKSLIEKEPNNKYNSEYGHLFYNEIDIPNENINIANILFLVKHENKRKLNSHLWFFTGFCRLIQPKYCFLIDTGTLVQKSALKYFYDELESTRNEDSNNIPKSQVTIAGVCGEIVPIIKSANFTDIFVHAQKVEYKFSHILDKALESVLGFITVLPGAFSGYNYKCLEPNNPKGPLLQDYFHSSRNSSMSCFEKNIYLAEDRVLCYSLVSSKNSANILSYVSKAKAETDVPTELSKLLLQRRRWINGSWFAMLNSIQILAQICRSGHSRCRKFVFFIQLIYMVLNALYSFLLVGSFYLAFSICVRKQLKSETIENDRSTTGTMLVLFYLAQLVLLMILSLGTKIKNVESAFNTISTILVCYMGLFIMLLIGIIMSNSQDIVLMGFIGGTALGFLIIICSNECLFYTLSSIVHFLIATPLYVNVFTIYAICNIHDVTWGNRPDSQNSEERSEIEKYKKFRTSWVLLWAYLNGFAAYLLDALDSKSSDYGKYVYFVGLFGMIVLILRFAGGIIYVFPQICCGCLRRHRN